MTGGPTTLFLDAAGRPMRGERERVEYCAHLRVCSGCDWFVSGALWCQQGARLHNAWRRLMEHPGKLAPELPPEIS